MEVVRVCLTMSEFFYFILLALQDTVTKSWLAKTGRGFTLDPLTSIGFESDVEVSLCDIF